MVVESQMLLEGVGVHLTRNNTETVYDDCITEHVSNHRLFYNCAVRIIICTYSDYS